MRANMRNTIWFSWSQIALLEFLEPKQLNYPFNNIIPLAHLSLMLKQSLEISVSLAYFNIFNVVIYIIITYMCRNGRGLHKGGAMS